MSFTRYCKRSKGNGQTHPSNVFTWKNNVVFLERKKQLNEKRGVLSDRKAKSLLQSTIFKKSLTSENYKNNYTRFCFFFDYTVCDPQNCVATNQLSNTVIE